MLTRAHQRLLRLHALWWLLPLLVLLVLSGVGLAIYKVLHERELRYQHQLELGLTTINQTQAQSVAQWRRNRWGEAMALLDDSLLAQAVQNWRNSPDANTHQALLLPLQAQLQTLVEQMQYSAAYLVDTKGQVLLSTSLEPLAQLPTPEMQALGEALAHATPQVVGLRRSTQWTFPFYSQVTPLFDEEQAVAAIWLVMDARTSLYPLLEVWPNHSRSAESVLLQRDAANTVRLLSRLRHSDEEPLLQSPHRESLGDTTLQQAAAGVRGLQYGRDYRQQSVLANISLVPNSDWLLVSKIDRAEMLSGAQGSTAFSLVWLTSLGLLAVGSLVFFWQWQAWHNERGLKEELQQNILWLEVAQRAASLGYFTYTLDTGSFILSPIARKVIGMHEDNTPVTFDRWLRLLYPEDRQRTLDIHTEAITQHQSLRIQYRIQRPNDGAVRWVEVWGDYDADSQPGQPRITGTVQDITERKQTEAQLAHYRASLEAQVRVDALTQIANRLALNETLRRQWQYAQRHQHPLALLMLDIDYFKAFNDNYGHVAGDRCLYDVAQALGRNLGRSGDFVARYGGEEFAVLLPDTSLPQAQATAERLRQAIRNLALPNAHGVDGIVTISIGAASLCPTPWQETHAEGAPPLPPASTDSVDIGTQPVTAIQGGPELVLLQQADTALYQAKQQGRDRVACFTPAQ